MSYRFRFPAPPCSFFVLLHQIKKIMPKLTKDEAAKKRAYAKDLFVKGIALDTVADIIGISLVTLRRWAKDDDFDSARAVATLSVSQMRRTILDAFVDLQNGRTPKVNPDAASKLAAAFEKLSDRRKVLPYMFEAYELLTDHFAHLVEQAPSRKEREVALDILKRVRAATDEVIAQTTTDQVHQTH